MSIPQCPRRWRYLTPAIPPDDNGGIEFHVRAVPGGLVSTAIVGETRPGDRWRLSSPHGGLQVDRDGGDVLMVAGSTGLAPLRSIIMDLTRWGKTHGCMCSSAAATRASSTTCRRCGRSQRTIPGCRCRRCPSTPLTRPGPASIPTSRRRAACTCARPVGCLKW
ncbi:oxidoreductase FAD-binding domain protein [Mycobacterium xenopi 3993]|nr:oxidoreductase FAD-binding domain protein [Mycobacterium xenopi 3993]